jgi:hypothetical protein
MDGWRLAGGSLGQSWQQASLDLRGHEAFRGSESPQTVPPLELARGRSELTLDLPTGSEAGDYDLQLVQGTSEPVATASGRAELLNGVTILRFELTCGRPVRDHPHCWCAGRARTGPHIRYWLSEACWARTQRANLSLLAPLENR